MENCCIGVAGAFSVVQTGSDGARKVRRCEDYRRSFHNATISNRCVDALVHLARVLLLVVAIIIHFVDDVGCPDAAFSAESSFASFDLLCEILGMKLKPSKAQPPAESHKILGVLIEIWHTGVWLRPDPGRIVKVLDIIATALRDDCLDSDTAGRLAVN